VDSRLPAARAGRHAAPSGEERAVTGYEWADDIMAVTITFVRGLGLRHVGDLIGVRWSTERTATFHDAQWQQVDSAAPVLQAAQFGDWLILIEPNGFLTTTSATAAALSAGGMAVSVFWNVNRLMNVVVAHDGEVVRRFDPLLFASTAQGEPLPEEAGLVFGEVEPSPLIAALELAERLTGVRVQKTWLFDEPRRTWTATEPT
jgi:hypothetical protein